MFRKSIAEKDCPTDPNAGSDGWQASANLDGRNAPDLGRVIQAYLEGITLRCSQITNAFISLDYHPGSSNPYPAIPLDIVGRDSWLGHC